MVKLQIHKNGVVNLLHPDPNHAEIVKLYLTLDPTTNHIKVTLTPKPNYLYSNKLISRYPISLTHVQSIIPGFQQEPLYLDEARITPQYANHYNRVLKNILPNAHPIYSYIDGYNFLGDAFINFALSLAIFEKNPEADTNTLVQTLNLYRSNKYLSTFALANGWTRYLTQVKLDYRAIAASFKGLIGATYKANGPDCIPKLLQYINKTLMADSPINYQNNTNWFKYLITGLSGFVVGALFTTLVITPELV
jgi:hypothetical protein